MARINFHLEVKSLQENLEGQVKIRTYELLRINQAFRKQEEDYRSVMKAVPDPIIVCDLKGHCVYINPAFTRVFGWTREDLLGKRPGFVVESERKRTLDDIEKIYVRGFLSDFHTRRHTRDGEVLDVSVSCASYKNTQGRIWALSRI